MGEEFLQKGLKSAMTLTYKIALVNNTIIKINFPNKNSWLILV